MLRSIIVWSSDWKHQLITKPGCCWHWNHTGLVQPAGSEAPLSSSLPAKQTPGWGKELLNQGCKPGLHLFLWIIYNPHHSSFVKLCHWDILGRVLITTLKAAKLLWRNPAQMVMKWSNGILILPKKREIFAGLKFLFTTGCCTRCYERWLRFSYLLSIN